jgi:RNA polymerase sigma-70 factor (ECF subfamily)
MGTVGLAITAEPIPLTLSTDFQDLYQRFSATVYRTALRVTGNPSDAEDVMQTVFLRVLHSPGDGLDAAQAPERYLRRAATNAAIDVLRKRTTRAESPLDTGPERAGPESTVLLKERVRRALAELPPQDAEMFTLRNLEGLSYLELAEHLGVERGTVASRLHRVRETLKDLISR